MPVVREIIADGGDWVDVGGVRKHVAGYLKDFLFDPNVLDAKIETFSGGEQSRLLLAREFARVSNLLILDEPTRGIDVGAKFEIYTIMAELAAQGKCIVMISSEMPELLGMCDRIYVMNEGRFVAEFSAAEASQEKIMRAIVKSGSH